MLLLSSRMRPTFRFKLSGIFDSWFWLISLISNLFWSKRFCTWTKLLWNVWSTLLSTWVPLPMPENISPSISVILQYDQTQLCNKKGTIMRMSSLSSTAIKWHTHWKKNCRIWFLRSTHDSKLTQNTTREVQEKKRKKELLFGWWENVGKERRWFSINLGPEERITPTQLSYTQWFWLGQGGFFNKINKSKRQNTWDLRLKTVVSFPFLGFLSNQTKNEASCAWRALAEKETPFP